MDVVKNIIRRDSIKRDCHSRANMKDLMGTSIGGMAGLGAIGAMNGIPGMPANNVGGLASTGVNLALLGNVAKIGMNIIPKGTTIKIPGSGTFKKVKK
jgi:hypothetical protein